jgi:uncharacterized protein YecT (DUF1311 family)
VGGVTLPGVPTTQPRYSVTDTGKTADLLDLAQQAWPDVRDRKELLLRLAEAGAGVVEQTLREQASSRELRLAAVMRSREMLDAGVLLSDQAWA